MIFTTIFLGLAWIAFFGSGCALVWFGIEQVIDHDDVTDFFFGPLIACFGFVFIAMCIAIIEAALKLS